MAEGVILPKAKPLSIEDKRSRKLHQQLVNIIESINEKEPPEKTVSSMNRAVAELNETDESNAKVKKAYRACRNHILKVAQKNHKWFPINYHRSLYSGIGLAAIGVPVGTALGLSLGTMAYLGLGLPIGLVVGLAIGGYLDKKAKKENRVINYEL